MCLCLFASFFLFKNKKQKKNKKKSVVRFDDDNVPHAEDAWSQSMLSGCSEYGTVRETRFVLLVFDCKKKLVSSINSVRGKMLNGAAQMTSD